LDRDSFKLDLALELGADAVINVEKENIVERANELTGGAAAPTATDWLPGQVTSGLQAYQAVPTPPPVRTDPPRPVPRSSGFKRTLIAAFSGLLVVLLLAITLVVLLKNGQSKDDDPPVSSPSASAVSTPTPVLAQPQGTRLGQYPDINISSGYSIDFVGNPKRPKEGNSDVGDLSFDTGILAGDNKFGVLAAGQTADYQTCHDNTIYTPSSPVAKGLRLCVYTRTGLLGIILVKNDTSEYVNLDLTVYQGPADQ
jgi:hypothetical protein